MLLICTASSGHNLELANRLAAIALEMGIEQRVVDLTASGLPMYTPKREEEGRPDELGPIEEAFGSATSFLVTAPEYNGSIPPVLSNTIAWLSTQSEDFRAVFTLKPLAIATHSGGGGQKVLVAMRLQFAHLGCTVLGREIQTNRKKPLNEDSARAVLSQLAALSGQSR